MKKLLAGIRQFQSKVYPARKELFEHLAQGQKPEALFITCSDSRIDPTLVTGTGPGDLFVLRNAGNIVPPSTAGATGEASTIEYAVSALRVPNVVVCGHTRCGAMDAILHPHHLQTLPAVAGFLRYADRVGQAVRSRHAHLQGLELLEAAVKENVLVQLENLRTLMPVASRLNDGDLRLHGWVYRIETGEVLAYDAEAADFVPVHHAKQPYA